MAYWGDSDKLWLSLNGPQRAAAMALLEADGRNPAHARNALGAIINRAAAEGQPLDQHVSRSIYQPTIEDNQRDRLNSIVQSPEFAQLSELAQGRASGAVPDWVNGADHYLAPPKTMLGLEAENPSKYKDWGPRGSNWTGYDPATGEYKNKVLEDGSHHFLKLYGDKPNAPVLADASTPQPYSPEAPSKPKSDAVLPFLAALMQAGGPAAAGGATATGGGGAGFLSQLFGGGDLEGIFGGEAAAAPPALNGITPLPTAPKVASGGEAGLLNQLFPQTLGSGGQPGQIPQSQGNAGGDLSANAMASSANGLARPALGTLARQPIDMSRLQQMLAQRPMLGMRPQG